MRLSGVIKCFLIALILPLNLYAITLEKCNEQDIKGIYNFIIYSNTYDHDLETFIVLDRVDDNIKIIPYAPEFKYRVFKNVNEKEALKIVNEVLKNPVYVSKVKCTGIRMKGIWLVMSLNRYTCHGYLGFQNQFKQSIKRKATQSLYS